MVLTDGGQLWANAQGWQDFLARRYELSNHGGLMWREWRKKHQHTDSLWCFMAVELVRMMGYTCKRNLSFGDSAASFLASWRVIADNATEEDMAIPRSYIRKKGLTLNALQTKACLVLSARESRDFAGWLVGEK